MKKMKIAALLLAAVMLAGVLAGCGETTAVPETAAETVAAATAESTVESTAETAAENATGNYKLVNTTGAVVTELYVYPNGGDKGENLAGKGLSDGASVDFSYTGAADTTLTVEFTVDGGETMRFESLHIETVTIRLLAADAMTGATPIQFGE